MVLDISLVLMLPVSSNPTSGHCDTYLACQVQEAELVPTRQQGQMP